MGHAVYQIDEIAHTEALTILRPLLEEQYKGRCFQLHLLQPGQPHIYATYIYMPQFLPHVEDQTSPHLHHKV